jgi:hypothetical protein
MLYFLSCLVATGEIEDNAKLSADEVKAAASA